MSTTIDPPRFTASTSNERLIGRGRVITSPSRDHRARGVALEPEAPGIAVEVTKPRPGFSVSRSSGGAVLMAEELANIEIARQAIHADAQEWQAFAAELGKTHEAERETEKMKEQARRVTKAIVRAMGTALVTKVREMTSGNKGRVYRMTRGR